jgi:hypothetical protein
MEVPSRKVFQIQPHTTRVLDELRKAEYRGLIILENDVQACPSGSGISSFIQSKWIARAQEI